MHVQCILNIHTPSHRVSTASVVFKVIFPILTFFLKRPGSAAVFLRHEGQRRESPCIYFPQRTFLFNHQRMSNTGWTQYAAVIKAITHMARNGHIFLQKHMHTHASVKARRANMQARTCRLQAVNAHRCSVTLIMFMAK